MTQRGPARGPVLLLEDERGRPTPALLEAYGEYRRDGGQEGD